MLHLVCDVTLPCLHDFPSSPLSMSEESFQEFSLRRRRYGGYQGVGCQAQNTCWAVEVGLRSFVLVGPGCVKGLSS